MDLELEVGQVTKEFQSLQEVLVIKEAEFTQPSTRKEQELAKKPWENYRKQKLSQIICTQQQQRNKAEQVV